MILKHDSKESCFLMFKNITFLTKTHCFDIKEYLDNNVVGRNDLLEKIKGNKAKIENKQHNRQHRKAGT